MRRAFVIGNVALDEVFQVRKLPQAGESVLGEVRHTGIGGKGANQAIALARTGVPTRLAAAVGKDGQAQRIRAALSHEPMQTRLIERPDLGSDRSLIFAQRDGNNLIVTTNACAASLSLAEAAEALDDAQPGDAVLLQGNLSLSVTAGVARHCARSGLTVVLNPSPFDAGMGELLPLTDVLFVNETEAQALTGLSGEAAARALLDAGARRVVLTLGDAGALLAAGDAMQHVPATPARVVDVTGAGDCFEGVALGSALRRAAAVDALALHHASLAAADAITRPGAADAFPSAERLGAMIEAGIANA